MHRYDSKQINGFTLVEALVAIAILVLVIIGPMTIAQKGIQTAHFANEQLTAVFLAQEVIEGIRELRDNNALETYDTFVHRYDTNPQPLKPSTDWMTDSYSPIRNCISSSDTNLLPCSITVRAGQIDAQQCSGGAEENCVLYVDSATGEYGSEGGAGKQATKFSRKVYLTRNGDNSLTVRVEVTWQGQIFNNTERRVELKTTIFDQYHHYSI